MHKTYRELDTDPHDLTVSISLAKTHTLGVGTTSVVIWMSITVEYDEEMPQGVRIQGDLESCYPRALTVNASTVFHLERLFR